MRNADPIPACENSPELLRRFAAGETRGAERRSVLEHLLRGCSSCRSTLRGIQERDSSGADENERGTQVADLLVSLHQRASQVERERADAASLMTSFCKHPPRRQWTLIRNSSRYDTWQFASKLLERSFEAIYDDARKANDLATMAQTLAQRLDPALYGQRLVDDLLARALAHVGNTQRALGNLPEAAHSLHSARQKMADGTGDPLIEAELLYFESSLARARREFGRAISKARSSQAIYREVGDEHLEGLAILGEGSVYLVMGEMDKAIPAYRRAMRMIQADRDPHLALAVRHNIAWCLLESGACHQALQELAAFRNDYARLGDRSALVKLRWLEAKIHQKLDRVDAAEVALRSAIAGLSELELPYEAAVASLDLASILATAGRYPEMRELAAETLVLFRALGVERESIAAWIVFQRAAEAEAVSTALIKRLADYYSQAKLRPGLAFES